MATPARTPNTATSTRPERSSRRTARKAPLGWLPWALLGLLALLVAATFLVINAVDDDGPAGAAGDTLGQLNSGGSGIDGQDGDGKIAGTEEGAAQEGTGQEGTGQEGNGQEGTGQEGTASAAPDAQASAGAGGSAASRSLTADGHDQHAEPAGGSLTDRAGQAVTGTATVESVVSDEGFWVGSSAKERVFVFLTPEARQSQGESGFQVTAGQTIQLDGAMTALQESPEVTEGVEAAEGADQLTSQGAYVRADSVNLA